ncbi:hypothetical protein RND71_015006 [Anisodus tanguticus]|uniref:Uncharacterized protein n=1 Tax=Anisodus tanguticus TaxID=243964 RepID=A0AAE1SCC3_9SOLA|nr:hypothetical protein RND71_015006 [Anisodus tanguticus]
MISSTPSFSIWQPFDHPTDSLLPGQSLVSGQKLTASISASNWIQAHFMKLGPDGHLRVYQWDNLEWKEISDILTPDFGNSCGCPTVDKNNEDMQLHKEAVTEMMSIAVWCLQGDSTKRPSMSLVVKVLEDFVTVETNLNYNFTDLPEVGARNQTREATISSILPSVLSGPSSKASRSNSSSATLDNNISPDSASILDLGQLTLLEHVLSSACALAAQQLVMRRW